MIDSAIDGIVSTLSEDMQRRRKELVQQRREIANQAAINKTQKTTQQPVRNQRSTRRPTQPAQRTGIFFSCHLDRIYFLISLDANHLKNS